GEVVAFPRRKDEPDAALAVKEGIKRGYTVFVFYGCEGGKPDHAYANTQLLYHLAREGFYGYLVGEETIATALVNRSFRFKPEGRVSVFALTERAKGVTIKGLSYSLTDAELQNDVPLGVSNAATGEEAEITVRDGALLLYWEK
ncbi:MAG: thiamine diphosphokinase, partial [Clostridia bacterium]|nr:thiamine diphosphokinase [Clostridia bacterium]